MQNLARLALLLLLLAQTGCGFYLRGEGDDRLAQQLGVLGVDGVMLESGFGRVLSDVLQSHGVRLQAAAETPGWRLLLRPPQERREVLSVDSSVHAREYSLVRSLDYQLQRGAAVAGAYERLEVRRDLVINPNDAIGSDYEAARLADEMDQELVDKLLFRIRRESLEDSAVNVVPAAAMDQKQGN